MSKIAVGEPQFRPLTIEIDNSHDARALMDMLNSAGRELWTEHAETFRVQLLKGCKQSLCMEKIDE